MKVLVLEQSNELAELLGLYISSLSSAEVHSTHLAEAAIKHMTDSDYDVFLCSLTFTRAGNDLVIRTWQEKHPAAQIVFLGEGDVPSGEEVYRVGHLHLVQELKELIKAPFWKRLAGKPHGQPLPMSPFLIYRLGVCPTDLYLKLGEENFVKLFHKGSPFGEEERAKFEAKGLREFWVLPEDISKAMIHFEDLLGSLTDTKSEEAALVSDATEFIWHMINESGFREDVQKVARQAMQQTLNLTRKNPDLKNFIDKMFRPEHGWLVRHALITSHVSCALAHQLGWTSEQTFLKLTVAALMHDMLLPSMETNEDIWIQAIQGEKLATTTNPELKVFLQHPMEGAQLLRRFRDIPPDTDKIVLEHHECPEGSGFPRGLTSSQISPLGCLFIIAHNVAEILLRDQARATNWNMTFVLAELNAERWQTGNFKKIWQALEKTSLFN